MKKVYLFLLLTMLFSAAHAQNATSGNVNFFLGNKSLSSDWAPYDSQGEFGILVDVAGPQWPVSLAVDLLGSSDQRGGWTVSTSELDLGVRKVFNLAGAPLHPYIGGGLAFVSATIDYYGWSTTENGTGLWLNGGFFVTLGEHFNLGLDLRHSSGDVDFGLGNIDAGGNHAGILLGYHW